MVTFRGFSHSLSCICHFVWVSNVLLGNFLRAVYKTRGRSSMEDSPNNESKIENIICVISMFKVLFLFTSQGVGLGSGVIGFFCNLYYITVMAWAILYFVQSLRTTDLPWMRCGQFLRLF